MTEVSIVGLAPAVALTKAPTGIQGFDELTGGGLPVGRPTLVCGNAGCGKSLFGIEFLVNGATCYGEPGVLMTFEETVDDVTQNVRSLGYDIEALVREKRLVVDYVHIDRSEIEETGEYDLEGLFIRLGHAIDSVGAKRVVLDTLEALFGGLSNDAVLRAELRRLFLWLKQRGVTAVITGERGEGSLTRHGLEEYVSDCVVMLDHRVIEQVATRRLRVVKYRGSSHGTNEYPFLIDEHGIDVMPVTSMGLDHRASNERVSLGIPHLDAMMGGKGAYRGSSVLVSGLAGSGKSSIAATFADASCRRGERCLMFAFEESTHQIVRNMRSIGIDLEPWITQGLLVIHCSRPTAFGLEAHLASTYKEVRDFDPASVIIDPITNFLSVGSRIDVKALLTRLIDLLKSRTITSLYASLSHDREEAASSEADISSLIDTWITLRYAEVGGERLRELTVHKSRGMAHSHHVRRYVITDHGIMLPEPSGNGDGVAVAMSGKALR